MDFKTYTTKIKLGEIKPKHLYTPTHDPFTTEFCGNYIIPLNKLAYTLYINDCFAIKKVIFNDPATIVLWEDGTKTVVKCGKDDTFDEEKGLALCFMKKALGNKGNYNNTIKEHIK